MSIGIALDAMGGDYLAVPNLQGAYAAIDLSLRSSPSDSEKLKVYLCGPRDRLMTSLDEAIADPKVTPEYTIDRAKFLKYLEDGSLEIIDSPQIVDMDESPANAIRHKKESSLAKAFHLVRDGKAGAALSAGNSGAVMAFGISILGRLPEVKRPAILCHFPAKSATGVTVLLDAGANVDCTAEILTQFAVMGATYYQTVFERSPATVALLNIGEEEGKGNEVVKNTAAQLKIRMPDNYVGFIEGRDLLTGKVDVIVCDGFVGNVALKTTEGVAQVIKDILKEEFSRNPIWGLGAWLARGGFTAMKTKLDYREYGAAPLIGLNGLGLVAHGSSDGKAICNAIRIAEKYCRQNLMEKLRRSFPEPTTAAAAAAVQEVRS